jgi:hypothetical protein
MQTCLNDRWKVIAALVLHLLQNYPNWCKKSSKKSIVIKICWNNINLIAQKTVAQNIFLFFRPNIMLFSDEWQKKNERKKKLIQI